MAESITFSREDVAHIKEILKQCEQRLGKLSKQLGEAKAEFTRDNVTVVVPAWGHDVAGATIDAGRSAQSKIDEVDQGMASMRKKYDELASVLTEFISANEATAEESASAIAKGK